jgi:type I restriction enzyme S subunit
MAIREVKLGKVATVKGGKRLPKGINLITKPNPHPYIRVRDLNGKKTLELDGSFEFVDDETQKAISRYIVTGGDIVLSIVGTIGLVSVVGDSLNEANLTENCVKLTSLSGIDRDYLYYYLKSSYGQQEIARGTVGAVQAKLPIKNIQDISIPLPDEVTQRKIADILSSLDAKIEVNQRINDNLYEIVNAYYTSLFKDVECEMTTIGNYAERIYSGGTPTTSNAAYWDGTFGWFSSGETRNRFVISTEKSITQTGIDNSSTKLASKHDIVMASAGQGFTRGQTSMLLIDTYVNQSVIVIHADRNILPYLFWNLANRYEELRAISDSSSIRGSLTTKMIAAFEIPCANNDVIQTFSGFAWAVIPQIENNLLENERLAALRDSLLPKLMTGEIDVSAIQL